MQNCPPLLHNSFPVWIICHATPRHDPRRRPAEETRNSNHHFQISPSLSPATSKFCQPPPPYFIHVTSALKKSGWNGNKRLFDDVRSSPLLFLLATAQASTSCEICVYTDIYPQNIKLRLFPVLAPGAMQILPYAVSI